MTTKRFTTVYDEKSKMMQYVDTQKEEQNWWAIWNANKTLQIMNELAEENEQLKQQLQKIQNSFEVNWTQNYEELDKDKLYIKDNNTEIRLDSRNLFIEVYIPQINEYYRFKYVVTRRSLMREFIENYNSNGDD